MKARAADPIPRDLGLLLRAGAIGGLSDGDLLARYVADGDEAAFEAIVHRLGPMVLGVCRRIIRDRDHADDAFQATFLVLARRARSVEPADRVGPWVHGVARRVAGKARARLILRSSREGQVTPFPDPAVGSGSPLDDFRPLLDRVIAGLPEKYRAPIVLCLLEGKNYREAARELGWREGTLSGRLSRGRALLADRLTRRGATASVAGLAALGMEATAAVPAGLLGRTARSACCFGQSAGAMSAGSVPAGVAALARGTWWTTTMIRSRFLFAATLSAGALSAGVAATARPAPATVAAFAPAPPPSPERKPLLANGDVEAGSGAVPAAWAEGQTIPGVTYAWSRDQAHGGKGSLGLKKTANRYFPIAGWSQDVAWPGVDARVKVSAWIKAESATKAILDVQFVDADGGATHAWVSYIGEKAAGEPPVTHDWKKYEGVVAVPPGTKRIVVAGQVYGPGTVWFDDLAAEGTDEAVTPPAAP